MSASPDRTGQVWAVGDEVFVVVRPGRRLEDGLRGFDHDCLTLEGGGVLPRSEYDDGKRWEEYPWMRRLA